MWGEILPASIGYQRRRMSGLSWCPAARVRTAAPPSGCAQAASSQRNGESARQRVVARHGTTSGASVKGRGCGCGRGRGSGRLSRARAARTGWATRKSAWRGAAAEGPAYGGCVTRCYAIQLAQLRYFLFLLVLRMRPQQLPIPSYLV
jgi:hypothetical protein